MARFVDLSGKIFGKLQAIKRVYPNINGRPAWECVCECGKVTIVPSNNLSSGNTKTCGCNKLAGFIDRTTHGLSGTPLNDLYYNIKIRCSGKHEVHESYTSKEITMSEEWESFPIFAEWAKANGYLDGLQIDRINNDKGYSPSNCRFINRTCNYLNKGTRNPFGVSGLEKSANGYTLRISFGSIKKFKIGEYSTILEAAKVREDFKNFVINTVGRLLDSELTDEVCSNVFRLFMGK